MKKLLLALALFLAPATAFAQCSGVFPASTVCGTVAGGVPGPIANSGGPGTPTNVLNTQTSNYTVATTDCGKTIQAGTGSTGLFTITLPSVSGFAGTCVATVVNGDTGRGKKLAGFPTNSPLILWPQQTIQVAIVNGVWQTTYNPGVWMPATIQTLNVDHTNGSDTSDCLGALGTSGACATIGHAFALFQTAIKVPFVQGFYPTIQTDCGFTESVVFIGVTTSGNGLTYIKGNSASPQSCVWTSATINIDLAVLGIDGFTLRSTGGVTVTVDNAGFLAQHNIIWGGTAGGTGTHVVITGTGSILAYDGGVYQVGEAACAPNCAAYHIQNTGGTDRKTSGGTLTVPNALTMTAFYYGFGSGSNTNYLAMTVSGAGAAGTTGFSYLAQNGAQADSGAVINYPGTSGVLANNFACARGLCAPLSVPTVFASLPTCNSASKGLRAFISDELAAVAFNTVATGSGSNNVPLFCDGTVWRIG